MDSDVSSEVKNLHNRMVFDISSAIFGETFDQVKELFSENPLSEAEISRAQNIQTLFKHLMKYEIIDYGNYEGFVSKINSIHPKVCTRVQKCTEDINKLRGNVNDQDNITVYMNEYEYKAKPGSYVTLQCDVQPTAEKIHWTKGKNKPPPPPKENISIDNQKYFSGSPEAPTLIIKEAEKKDESYYQCIARHKRNKAFSPIVHVEVDEVGELEQEEQQEVSEQETSQEVVEPEPEMQRPTPKVRDSSLDVADTHRSRLARNREQPIWITNADGVESVSGATEKSSVSRCRRKSWPMIEKREKVTTGKRVLSIPHSLFDALKCVLSFLITDSIDVSREASSSDIQLIFAEVTGIPGRVEVFLIPQCVLVRIEIEGARSLTEPSALHLAEKFKHYILNGGVIQLSDESNTILTVDKTSLKITPQHVPEDGSPYVSISQGDFTGSKGKMIFLQTYIIASPSVLAIQWFKVNEGDKLRPIEIDNKRYFGGSDLSPTLIIRNVNREDQGCYFCVARNERGIGSSHRTFIRIDTAQSEAKRPGMGEKEQQKGPSEAKRSRIGEKNQQKGPSEAKRSRIGEKDQQKAKEKSSESVISVVATDREEPNVGDGITSQGVMKQNVSDVTTHHVILQAQVSDVSTGREVMEPDISHVTSGQRVLEPQVGDFADRGGMEQNVIDVTSGQGVPDLQIGDVVDRRVMEPNVIDVTSGQGVMQLQVGNKTTGRGVTEADISDLSTNQEVMETDVCDVSTGHGVMEINVSDDTTGLRVMESKVGDVNTGHGVMETDICDDTSCMGVMETEVCDVGTGPCVLETKVCDYTTGPGDMETKLSEDTSVLEVIKSDVCNVSTGQDVKLNIIPKVGDDSITASDKHSTKDPKEECPGITLPSQTSSPRPLHWRQQQVDYIRKYHIQMIRELGRMFSPKEWRSICNQVQMMEYVSTRDMGDVARMKDLCMALMRRGVISYGEYSNLREILVTCNVQAGDIIDDFTSKIRQEMEGPSEAKRSRIGEKDQQKDQMEDFHRVTLSSPSTSLQQQLRNIRRYQTEMIVKLASRFAGNQLHSIYNLVEMMGYLTPRDLDDVKSMEKLCMVLMKKGVIQYGEYSKLRNILVTFDVKAGEIIDEFTKKIRQEKKGTLTVRKAVPIQKTEMHPALRPLIGTTKAMIMKAENEKFYPTKGFQNAKEKLLKNRVVVIKGNTGDGKTAIAVRLLHWLSNEQQAGQPLQIHSMEKLDLLTPNSKLITFIDDIFGEKDQKDLNEWNKRISDVKTLFADVDANNFLLITIRNEVFNSLSKCSREVFFTDENVIDLSLDIYNIKEEKRKLLDLYKPKQMTWTEEEKDKIINNAPNIGFPQCCQLFYTSENLQKEGSNFFEKPFHFLLATFSRLKEFSALLYLFFNGGMIRVKDLNPNGENVNTKMLEDVFNINLIPGEDDRFKLTYKKKVTFVKESLEKLSGVFVMKEKRWYGEDVYRFHHDSIYVAVALWYGKATPIGYIQNCPSKCLSYLTTSETATNMVFISSDHYTDMCERLLREFEFKDWYKSSVDSLDVWNDPVFLQRFVGLLNERKIDKLVLNEACKFGAEKCTLFLLSVGVKPDKDTALSLVRRRWNDGNKQLCSLKEIVVCLDDEAKLDVLNVACLFGAEECASYLLLKIRPDKDTALSLVHGDWENSTRQVNLLKDIVQRTTDDINLAVLNEACWSGVEECALYLLCEVVEPDEVTVFYVVEGGSIKLLRKLLKYDVTPTARGYNKDNVLHMACLYEREEMVTLLCDTYPNLVHGTDKAGQTPLHVLAQEGNICMFKTVEKFALNSLYRVENQQTKCESADGRLIHRNCMCAQYMSELVESEGKTVLHLSCYLEKREICLHLCQSYPALTTVVDKLGCHCLHYIAGSSFRDVDLFTECEAHVKQYVESIGGMYDITTILDNDGRTALHYSCGCWSGKVNREVCLYLCPSYPGLIPIVDKDGQHCLHYIARNTSDVDVFTECETYVKQYVESTGRKYDVTTILTNDGESVLDMAKNRKSTNNPLLDHLVKVFGQ